VLDLLSLYTIGAKKMIISFSIQNFGSIKDKQTLSFEADKSDHLEEYYVVKTHGMRLLKMALIYGANASGKTTVLKALDFLRELVLKPKAQKTDVLDFQPFLFDDQTPHQSSILAIDFLQNDVRYFYEVEFTQQAVLREELYSYKTKKANVFKRTTDVDKQLSAITFGSKIKINKTAEQILEANTLWNTTVLGGFLKTNLAVVELEESTKWFNQFLLPTVYTNLELHKLDEMHRISLLIKNNIVIMLKKADFHISNLELKKPKETIREDFIEKLKDSGVPNLHLELLKDDLPKKIEFEHTINGKQYSLPIELESQGTQRYYEFALILNFLIRLSKAFSIDELESSLHPDLYTHFLLTFLVNTKSSQLIATTHNREILNNKDIFRNDAIWFTDKNELCATELYSLADFDSSVVRDTTNIYNAYKIGKLGGVPNLGDYYIDLNSEG
jgi:hypothetical protein